MSLKVIVRGDVCELRIDAPPGNILDAATCGAMEEAVRTQARDPHLKAILFTAAGKHFSYGASVPEHRAGEVDKFLPRFHGVFNALADTCVPTIGAVRGHCLGGAFELILACHIVIAEETASFAAPEIKLGVLPPAACALLPWKVGGGLAEDLVLTGRSMAAAEAHRHGLVNRLVSQGELETAVEAFLKEGIRPKSASALRLAARAVRDPLNRELRARLDELERFYLEDVMGTRDANEGIEAFLSKRKPAWVDQ